MSLVFHYRSRATPLSLGPPAPVIVQGTHKSLPIIGYARLSLLPSLPLPSPSSYLAKATLADDAKKVEITRPYAI